MFGDEIVFPEKKKNGIFFCAAQLKCKNVKKDNPSIYP